MLRLLLIVGMIAVWQQSAPAQATQPDDAAKIYLQAAKLLAANDKVNIMSPSASNLDYANYPPYPAAWQRMEKTDFTANIEARALAHQARSIEHANWPKFVRPHPDISYLNDCRNLSNELADAALYEHLHGEDAAAIETLRDQWHLATTIKDQGDANFIRLLVGVGIQAQNCSRFEIVTSGVNLTKDPNDTKDLQTSVARELIGVLLKQQDAKTEMDDILRVEGEPANAITQPSIDRGTETLNRVNTERGLAAMSLACHLDRFDNDQWPKSLDDLTGYLPNVPIDLWGDGKQTLGYALIKGGLPDGTDRPLVYSRCKTNDGLFYRIDQPVYSFDNGIGAKNHRKYGGQFRDVASWAPAIGSHPWPTTRPLE